MKINPTKPTSISAYIAACQHAANISDRQISDALGFKNPTVFESIKQGKVKLPFALVQKLADALSIDGSDLLRKVMQEYMPEVITAVDELLQPAKLSANERKLLSTYRQLSDGQDVQPMVIDGNSVIALVVM